MNVSFRWFCLLPLFYLPLLLSAQLQQAYVPGELMVMLQPGTELSSFLKLRYQVGDESVSLTHKQVLSERVRIHLLSFEDLNGAEESLLYQVRRQEGVVLAQFNHYVQSREMLATQPSDPQFGTQWDMENTGQGGGTVDADVDATEAWDITTGGLTSLGDTIVVAVIDGGTDLNHPDLSLWKNHAEIPNNGIDDDNNGYVDDYDGWNAYNNTGNILSDGHGTHVAGTIAAKGNNGIGVSGLNWDAQVMPISGSSGQESTVVTAYAYALDARVRYNLSDGSEGALVVATNSSFGVDFADPVNFPIWCAMYDTLGAAGILSAAATMNNSSNVDNTGDVPTACPSDWMISVTNTTRFDSRNNGAAFGLTTIDLGAPGTQILSTLPNASYGNLTGTSMATPHVAGAVALVLSAACPGFVIQYKNNPAAMAIVLRDFLLQGVDPVPDLTGATVTGGRLNVHESILLLQTDCVLFSECSPVNDAYFTGITDTSALANWVMIDSASSYHLRYRPVSDSVWTYLSGVASTSTELMGLEACTEYEMQVESICGTDSSDFFDFLTFSFQTEGCCEFPSQQQVLASTDSSSSLQWASVYGATAYEIRYRQLGDSVWTVRLATDTTSLLENLAACSEYEWQVSTICDKQQLDFSPSYFLSTKGCGICIEGDYCDARGGSSSLGWVEKLILASFQNTSGSDGGYGNYYEADEQLLIGQSHPITLIPGFSVAGPKAMWRVWLDKNMDSDFSDPGELVYESAPSATPVTGLIDLENTLPLGRTRMRVSMKLGSNPNVAPLACDSFPLGEVEDYCLNLNVSCDPITDLAVEKRYDGSELLDLSWSELHPDVKYLLAYRPSSGGPWTELQLDTNAATLGPLLTCESYEFQVQPLCLTDTGSVGSVATVRTLGCGFCQDEPYCASRGDAGQDWIESLTIGTFSQLSGSNGGYGDFTGLGPQLSRGASVAVELTPSNLTAAYHWRIWADLDQDGLLDDSTELLLSSTQAVSGIYQANLNLPLAALGGTTRLRVSLRKAGEPSVCGNLDQGEVEDYCLRIEAPLGLEDAWTQQIQLYPNPTEGLFSVSAPLEILSLQLWDVQGRQLQAFPKIGDTSAEMNLQALPSGLYFLEIVTRKGTVVKQVVRE